MATYINDLRLKEIATGDEAGTWGTSTNTNLELIGEALGYGTQNCFTTNANATTTVADGATDPARAMYFKVTSSATLTATRTLTIGPNTISRVMLIENATTGSQSITISQGTGANVTIPSGSVKMVYLDGAGSGAAVVDALAALNITGSFTASSLSANSILPALGLYDTSTANSSLIVYHDGGDTTFRSQFGTSYGEFDFVVYNGTTTVQPLNINSSGILVDGTVTVGGTASVTKSADAATALTSFTNANSGTSARASISFTSDTGSSAVGTVSSTWNVDALNANETFLYGSNGVSLFAPASQNIRFIAGASEKARIASSGNVGIGESNPSEKLSIGKGISYNADSALFSTIGVNDTAVDNNAVYRWRTGITGNATGHSYTFSTLARTQGSYVERMRIASNGNLLVGGTSTTSTPTLNRGVYLQSQTNNDVIGYSLYVDESANSRRVSFFLDDSAGVYGVDSTASTGVPEFVIKTAGTEAVRVDDSGNVGIGTSSPTVPLHILKAASGVNQATDVLRLSSVDTDTSYYVGFQTQRDNSAGMGLNILTTNVLGTVSEAMRITPSGNVGIGTTSPARQLHVKDSSTYGYARVEGASGGYGGVLELVSNSLGSGTDFAGVLDFYMTTSNHIGRIKVQRQAGAADNGDMLFYTASGGSITERMRIDSSGNLLLGITSNTINANGFIAQSDGVTKVTSTSDPLWVNRRSSTGTLVNFYNDSALKGTISTNGTTVSYNTSSDARLKENIVSAPSASDDIDALTVRSFNWKSDGSHQKYGMIAQELLEVAPEAVHQPDDPEEMMGVDYSKLVPMLVKEIQSLRARVAQLEGA